MTRQRVFKGGRPTVPLWVRGAHTSATRPALRGAAAPCFKEIMSLSTAIEAAEVEDSRELPPELSKEARTREVAEAEAVPTLPTSCWARMATTFGLRKSCAIFLRLGYGFCAGWWKETSGGAGEGRGGR